jgi:hypothetical protein
MKTFNKKIKQGQTRVLAITNEPAAYWMLVAILVVSFSLYVMFVNQTVRNVVKRQSFENEISTLTSHLGDLEFKDISMKNDITIDKAYAMGFKDVAETKFLARASGNEVAMSGTIR